MFWWDTWWFFMFCIIDGEKKRLHSVLPPVDQTSILWLFFWNFFVFKFIIINTSLLYKLRSFTVMFHYMYIYCALIMSTHSLTNSLALPFWPLPFVHFLFPNSASPISRSSLFIFGSTGDLTGPRALCMLGKRSLCYIPAIFLRIILLNMASSSSVLFFCTWCDFILFLWLNNIYHIFFIPFIFW